MMLQKNECFFVNRMMSLLNPGMMIIMNVTSLCILWVGAYAINNNVLNIGDVFGFQQYAMIICMAFMQLIMIFVMVPRGMVSAKRINEVLESKNLITEPENSIKPLEKGSIEFKNVSFMYPGSNEPVLSNISFKIEDGETLAIIGSTGSGKKVLF
ncbi:MAG: ABC transporter ATP-binding protein/permease [Clostridium sp.]|nr:MAG: ABC transporter ATP-binding protein/permease [Clostridium sp.]